MESGEIMRKPKAALLPLFLDLYDKTGAVRRDGFAPLFDTIRDRMAAAGVDLVEAPIACVEPEVKAAVDSCERDGVDIIVALHLAYSPSLESAAVLAKSSLPLLLLDTTMDYDFGPDVEPQRILYNHGIHGVQDLANVLGRMGKAYHIVAGHITESDVIDRAAEHVRAAYAAKVLRGMKVLRIGQPFQGMGDFAVPDAVLAERFAIDVRTHPADALAAWIAKVTDDEVETEFQRNVTEFEVAAPEDTHRGSVRVGLGLRRMLDDGGYRAFSMNFQAFDRADGPVNRVPFLEASRAMERGLGYAGEGDVLTAALVGALSAAFGKTTFTEMFCPDWKSGSVFFSHMGEINPATIAGTPRLIEMDYPYSEALNPLILTGDMAPGVATLVNLAPGPNDTFSIIAAAMQVHGEAGHLAMKNSIRGWARPELELSDFLEAYSELGGTHHSALVYGDHTEAIEAFAQLAGIDASFVL